MLSPSRDALRGELPSGWRAAGRRRSCRDSPAVRVRARGRTAMLIRPPRRVTGSANEPDLCLLSVRRQDLTCRDIPRVCVRGSCAADDRARAGNGARCRAAGVTSSDHRNPWRYHTNRPTPGARVFGSIAAAQAIAPAIRHAYSPGDYRTDAGAASSSTVAPVSADRSALSISRIVDTPSGAPGSSSRCWLIGSPRSRAMNARAKSR